MDTVQDSSPTSGSEEKPKASSKSQNVTPVSPDKSAKPARPPVGTSAGARTKTVDSEPPADPVNKLRRRVIWISVSAFLAACFIMFQRFFFPRTLFEPPTKFRVGYPTDFGFGVDTKFQQQYRIWVVRNAERLFVISAVCTHLGCTPDWKPSENKFKCPCHGSGYDSEGINFEGPAPRPMDRAHVELDPSGQILVDVAKLYAQKKGEATQFDDYDAGRNSGAYLIV